MLYSIENFRYVMPFVHTCCTTFTLKVRDKKERDIVRVKSKSPLRMKMVLNKLDKKFVKKNSHLIIYLKNDDSSKTTIYNIYSFLSIVLLLLSCCVLFIILSGSLYIHLCSK